MIDKGMNARIRKAGFTINQAVCLPFPGKHEMS